MQSQIPQHHTTAYPVTHPDFRVPVRVNKKLRFSKLCKGFSRFSVAKSLNLSYNDYDLVNTPHVHGRTYHVRCCYYRSLGNASHPSPLLVGLITHISAKRLFELFVSGGLIPVNPLEHKISRRVVKTI